MSLCTKSLIQYYFWWFVSIHDPIHINIIIILFAIRREKPA